MNSRTEKSTKTAVIYCTVYGTTKRYAEWIAEELNADLIHAKELKHKDINSYDFIIYGGGLYAGGIIGVKAVAKIEPEKLIVFTVGLATPHLTDYTKIINMAFGDKNKVKFFHFQGGMDYKKLSLMHRMMMSTVKRKAEKTPVERRTYDDIMLLETYGKQVDFTDKKAIKPLVEFINTEFYLTKKY